jgi:hypothetical protein
MWFLNVKIERKHAIVIAEESEINWLSYRLDFSAEQNH